MDGRDERLLRLRSEREHTVEERWHARIAQLPNVADQLCALLMERL